MRHTILTFLFLLLIGTGTGLGFGSTDDTMLFVPVSVKDQAVEKTLQYGSELCLRQDFDQAINLYKHVITLDACNPEAREGLKQIAERGHKTETINAYLAGLDCREMPAPQVATVEPEDALIPEPEPAQELHLTSKEYQQVVESASPQLRSIINYKDQNISTLKERLAQEVSGELPPAHTTGTVAINAPAPVKAVSFEPMKAAPVNAGTKATPVPSRHVPLKGQTLQEKLADLQKRIQRVENTAQNQSTRLNSLNNELSTTQN